MEGTVKMKLEDVLNLIAESERLKKEHELKLKEIRESFIVIEGFLKEPIYINPIDLNRQVKVEELLEIYLRKNNITINKIQFNI